MDGCSGNSSDGDALRGDSQAISDLSARSGRRGFVLKKSDG